MRIKSSYVKMFLANLLIFAFAMFLVFTYGYFVRERYFKSRFEKFKKAGHFAIKEVVSERFKLLNLEKLQTDRELQSVLKEYALLYDADFIFTDSNRDIVYRTFVGEIPSRYQNILDHLEERKQRISLGYIIDLQFETISGSKIFLHVFFKNPDGASDFIAFSGLAIIGVLISILLLLATRILTKPLQQLKDSSLELANGNFKSRVTIDSGDEFEDLGRVFNRMASAIEEIFANTRQNAANISHELRSPLARINISKEIISDHIELNDYKMIPYQLSLIDREIGVMDNQIQAILDYYKLEATSNFEKGLVDLSKLLDSSISKVFQEIEYRGIDLKRAIESDIMVRLSSNFEVVLNNLIGNGIKYCEDGGNLEISLEKVDGTTTITISNSCEFKPNDDELERIFEPFYRGKNLPDDRKGTGMGLAIVKKVVQLNEGSITASIDDKRISFKVVV